MYEYIKKARKEGVCALCICDRFYSKKLRSLREASHDTTAATHTIVFFVLFSENVYSTGNDLRQTANVNHFSEYIYMND